MLLPSWKGSSARYCQPPAPVPLARPRRLPAPPHWRRPRHDQPFDQPRRHHRCRDFEAAAGSGHRTRGVFGQRRLFQSCTCNTCVPHGSSHIGSPTILPAPVASITTRGLSTVIPGAGAASAAGTPFRAPRAGTRSSLASDPPASVQCPSSSFMGRGIFSVSRSVVADLIGKGVPSTIAGASRVAGARHSRECHGWDTDLQGSRPEQD